MLQKFNLMIMNNRNFKIKKTILITVLFVFAIGIMAFSRFYSVQRDKLLIDVVAQSLTQFHFQKNKFDDEFSKGVFDNFLDALDRNKTIFLKQDIESFKKHQLLIDNQISEKDLQFFEDVNTVYEMRFKELETYFATILDQPFDMAKEEFLETDDEKTQYVSTEEERFDKWHQWLKYEAIRQIYNRNDAQLKEKEKNDSITLKSLENTELEVRTKLKKEYQDWFHRLEKYDRNDRFSLYLNTITGYFDPHTNYFSPNDKESFDISMSGQLEGIGATLQESEGYVKVANIVAGGPAWKQGELKAGDLILEVAQGNDESVSVIDMRLDNAVQLIRGKKGTVVKLLIKKPDGSLQKIAIVRDKVVIEETYARSAILENTKAGEKVGYINLPKFYADFQQASGRRSSVDIKKELEKLNKEGVQSLIFDLRDNTGGSLADVVEMFGYFITTGPVVQVKDNRGQIKVHEDRDKEVVFDKPLVVLINEGSASASEIFAAAVQDYGRGIIMGSPYSFGKGTVQQFLDFDQMLNSGYNQYKPLGALKITIQKFYRITGGSTQLKGVASDIVLADAYKYIPLGEREQYHAMPWDEIAKTPYTELQITDIKKIIKKSEKRISQDTLYSLLEENALRMKQIKDETNFPLNYSAYVKLMTTRNQQYEKFKSLNQTKSFLEMKALESDLTALAADSTKTKILEQWVSSLKKDYYLDEAYKVAIDL